MGEALNRMSFTLGSIPSTMVYHRKICCKIGIFFEVTISHIEIVYKWKKNNLKEKQSLEAFDFIDFFHISHLEQMMYA